MFETLDALWLSAAIVALAEMGDKTQLLAIVLAARFRKPGLILLGILAATLLNHAAAAGLGGLLGAWLEGRTFQLVVGAGFIAMAAWALVPDKEDERAPMAGAGVFLTTMIAFFLVEIGDKTQIATSLLGARYNDIALVTLGSTTGMLAANAPAVFAGEALTRFAPLQLMRLAAALLMAATGLWIVAAAWLAG